MGKNQLLCFTRSRYDSNNFRDVWSYSLDDTNFFTKQTLLDNHTVDKLTALKGTLETYYLPCKSKVYLQDINEKRRITILKQFIKMYGYTTISKERYINRKSPSIPSYQSR